MYPPGFVIRCVFYFRKKMCPNCAHEESKSFTAIRNPSKTLMKNFGLFPNEERKMPINSIISNAYDRSS
jgi:hypothetical protein